MKYKSNTFVLSLSMVMLTSNISYAVQDTNFGLGKAILKLLSYTLILVFVLVVTIYGTKFIAKKSKKFANGKYIQILDSLSMGTNTKIVIIKVNNMIYIIAIANNTIEVIDKLPVEEFEFHNEVDFEEQLDKYKNKYIYDNEFISRFQARIKKILTRSDNNFNSKEDEDDEKKC
jgi:flagellar biogenesis protein FliO